MIKRQQKNEIHQALQRNNSSSAITHLSTCTDRVHIFDVIERLASQKHTSLFVFSNQLVQYKMILFAHILKSL